MSLNRKAVAMESFEPKYRTTIDIAQYTLHQGDSRSANLVEGFIPLYQSSPNLLSFADIRFYNPNGAPMEGNVDLGIRRLFQQSHSLAGLYAGYDRYRSQTKRYYSQLNAGVEFWLKRFFVGGNVYVPFGTTVYDNDAVNQAYLVPTTTSYRYNIAYAQGKERAMPGADAEVGVDINHGLTAYAGGYYFDHTDARRITGPKLRATYTFYRSYSHWFLNIFDRIRLEGLLSHDSVRGTSWMAGIRFRFGLSKHTNPSTGLARHMTDPIRRDLNVVSENFNATAEFYKIDGRKARIDLISNTSGRDIDTAVSASSNAADIIGIRSNQTASNPLTLGARALTITGGNYEFSVNDHPYTVINLGYSGVLNAPSSNNLFDVSSDANITLEHLTTVTDANALTLQNQGDSFGTLTIKDLTSNAAFDFALTASNATGNLQFTNNSLVIDPTTTDANVSSEYAAVILTTNDNSQQLTVNAFRGNDITVSNLTTSGVKINGIYIEGNSAASPIQFTHNFIDNTISMQSNTFTGGTSVPNISCISSGNTIWRKNFNSNRLSLKLNTVDTGFINGWFFMDNSTNTINGNIRNNLFETNQNDGFSTGWISINTSTITINGDIISNTLTENQNDDSGIGWVFANTSTVTINGNILNNDFTENKNFNSVGWLFTSNSSVTINGHISNNTFMQNENDSLAYGWSVENGGTNIINGNISKNRFIENKNAATGAGWIVQDNGTATINGNIVNNSFTTNENLNGVDWGFETNATVTIDGIINGNTFTQKQNDSNALGWLFRDSSTIAIQGSINGNKFTQNGNGDISYIWDFENSDITITDNITRNQFNSTNNTNCSVGINISLNIADTITFEQPITKNTFNTDTYGFLFTVTAGTLNIQGNISPTELSSSNYGAIVDPTSSNPFIIYG
jgi:hypothetical protein